MLKTATTFAIVFLACAGAQTRPNFSGVWAGPEQVTVRIEHNAEKLAITMRAIRGGNTEQQSMRYTIGQESKNEMHGSPATSHAEWDGDTLVIRTVAVIMNKELKLNNRFSLSADGTTLTFRERAQCGTEPERDEARVFERRPPDSWGPDVPLGPANLPVVVFVTAFDQYAIRAFEVCALDHLLKPFDRERFQQTLARARGEHERRNAGEWSDRLRTVLDELRSRARHVDRLIVRPGAA